MMDEAAARMIAEDTAREVLGTYAPHARDLCLQKEFVEDDNVYIFYIRGELALAFQPGSFRNFAYAVVKSNGLVRLIYDYRHDLPRKAAYEREASDMAKNHWSKEVAKIN